MSEFKGTPGPWQEKGSTIYGDGRMSPVADVVHFHPDGTSWTPDDRANARLIAAAPDLLEAVQVLLMSCTYREGGEAHRRAEAAIAKALGEQA